MGSDILIREAVVADYSALARLTIQLGYDYEPGDKR